jgi:peptidoglycan hydrolase-like protein with peptidoglycan-binding domain
MRFSGAVLALLLGALPFGLAYAQDIKPKPVKTETIRVPKPAQAETTAKSKPIKTETIRLAKPDAKPATGAQPTETAPAAAAAAKPAPAPPKAPQALKDAYAAMPVGERVSLQSDLIWSGDYNGTATGDFSDRAIAAVKAFQKRNKGEQTGILKSEERALLAATVKTKQDEVGWRLIDDAASGARIGLPSKMAPQTGTGRNGGSRWTSTRGEVQIETFRIRQQGTTLQSVFDQQKKEAARQVEYNVIRPDFFVISGLQGLKKFYIRAHIKDGEVRGMAVLYDQATEGMMEPVVVAMSSIYAAFPDGPLAAPPPKRKVEYASGIVVTTTGDIVTSRQATDACEVIVVAGRGNAVRVAQDKESDLALLRLYGARDLEPVALGAEVPKSGELTLVGIADPQTQAGGAKISTLAAKLNANATGIAIEPAPGLGFAGAAVLDSQGQIAGMVELRPVVVAGPAPAGAQAALISAASIRKFLEAQNVAAATGHTAAEQAKASIVRVICVRK